MKRYSSSAEANVSPQSHEQQNLVDKNPVATSKIILQVSVERMHPKFNNSFERRVS